MELTNERAAFRALMTLDLPVALAGALVAVSGGGGAVEGVEMGVRSSVGAGASREVDRALRAV